MFVKQTAAVLACLALANEAGAFNAHRHLHHVQRDVYTHTRTHVVTEWVTVTVTAGRNAQPTPNAPAPTTLITHVAPAPAAPSPPSSEEAQEGHEEADDQGPSPDPAPVPAPAPAPQVDEQDANHDVPDSIDQPASSSDGSDTGAGSGGSSGPKRGFAYNDAHLVDNFFSGRRASASKFGWAWNWDSRDNGLAQSLEFVPTLWGPIDIHTSRWKDNVESMIDSGSTHVFSFNECDIASQCNMDAAAAADAHVKWLNPYAGRVKISSPSVSNSNVAGQGLDWLRAWVDACDAKGCAYDFCNVHWYSPIEATETLYDHIKEAARICRKPVWLTEFAPLSNDDAAVSAWLEENLPRLDDLDELERYSYFMVSNGKLVNGNALTGAGEAYATA